jgi:predicted amidohydrolase
MIMDSISTNTSSPALAASFASPESTSDGWMQWSPRAEIAPRFSRDNTGGRKGRGSLLIACDNAASWGTWRRRHPVTAGQAYRFAASFRAWKVAFPLRCVSAQLDWLDAKGNRVRPPDYASPTRTEDGWTWLEYTTTAPTEARSVSIDLAFGWSPGGVVRWDNVELRPETVPPDRVVRAVTIRERPQSTLHAATSLEHFCRRIEEAEPHRPDIICLPEGVTLIGNGLSYAEVCEPLHGPTAQRLGTLARQLNCYIVAGIYERAGPVIYNTAILLGRDGKLAGSYRKTHLPREEVEGGLTPGNDYPIFETDFGKIGILICWDLQFPEPWRALALAGAEIVLLPIWGGSEPLAYARAIENHIFVVSSSYDMKSFILDPTGAVLAEATTEQPIAVAELHLDRPILQPWLGDMKARTWKERRADLAGLL